MEIIKLKALADLTEVEEEKMRLEPTLKVFKGDKQTKREMIQNLNLDAKMFRVLRASKEYEYGQPTSYNVSVEYVWKKERFLFWWTAVPLCDIGLYFDKITISHFKHENDYDIKKLIRDSGYKDVRVNLNHDCDTEWSGITR